MNTYVAFLRGINVGGQKRFSMSDQERLFSALGYKNIRAYLQTGNVVFQTQKTSKEATSEIQAAISEKYGWEVPILIKTTSEIAAIVKHCPFSQEKKEKSYFTLLHAIPNSVERTAIASEASKEEEFIIAETCIYFFPENGYGRAKFNNNYFETKLKVTATTRNYRTMKKVLTLLEDVSN